MDNIVDQMLAMQDEISPEEGTVPETVEEVTEGAQTVVTEEADTQAGSSDEVQKEGEASAPVAKSVDLEETFDKSNKAFAEMRRKNRDMEEVLMRLAQTTGLGATSADEALNKLSGVLTEEEAKSKKLDPVILRTIQEQQKKIEAYEQEEIRKEANASFQELQKKFNLDTKELTSFAKQLSTAGINPFTSRNVNLSQHYLEMNWQKLIEKAEERGMAKEAERNKRLAQSTKPAQAVGRGTDTVTDGMPTTGDPVRDFRNLLGIK